MRYHPFRESLGEVAHPAGLVNQVVRPSGSDRQKSGPFEQTPLHVICGWFGLTVGAIVLLGWALRIDVLTRILPGYIAMNPATAVALICGGFALAAPGRMIGLKRVGALAVASIAVSKLAQLLGVISWSVDQVLFSRAIKGIGGQSASLMTPSTAFALFLLGYCLFLNTLESKPTRRAAQIAAGAAAALSLIPIFGFALGMGDRFATLPFVPMPFPTGLAICSLAIGNLTIRPSLLTTVLRDRGPAGLLARTILPLSIVLPLALGGVRLAGEKAGFYGTEVGVVLLTAGNAAVLFSLLLTTILALHRSDGARLKREAAVARSEDLYRLAERVASVGHWRLDASDKSVTWSDATFMLVGRAKERGVPSAAEILEMYHPDDRAEVRAKLIHALKTGEGWEIMIRLVRQDGEVRTVVSHGLCERSEDERVTAVFGVFADVTERENAIQEQLDAKAKLRAIQVEFIHLSRVTAMGTMAATLAHELNQPLTAIKNYTGGLERMIARDGQISELSEPLAAIGKNAARAGEIIRRLREMTQKGEITSEAFIPDSVIKEAGALASVGVCQGLRLHYDFSDGQPVRGDPVQIQQVLINLIRNACHAVVGGKDPNVRVISRIVGDDTLIAVEDNGPGISPDALPTLFEAFATTKADGMGVGLSISRTIIEAHGGRIWAENRSEGGARFSFTLPLARPSRANGK